MLSKEVITSLIIGLTTIHCMSRPFIVGEIYIGGFAVASHTRIVRYDFNLNIPRS